MQDCEQYLELMSGYVDGALTQKEEMELAKHMGQCEECRQKLVQMQEMHRLASEDRVEAPEGLLRAAMARVRETEQETPLTALPEEPGPDARAQARAQLAAWWKPVLRSGALAACLVLIFSAGIWVKWLLDLGGNKAADSTGSYSAESAAADTTAGGENGAVDDSASDATMDTGAEAADTAPAPADSEDAAGQSAVWETLLEMDGLSPISDEAPCGVLVVWELPADRREALGTPAVEENGVTAYLIPVEDWTALRDELLDTDADAQAITGEAGARQGWVYCLER